MLTAVAQHLQLARLVAVAVGTQAAHDLVHGLSGRLVLVEKVSSEQDHVHITFFSSAHDLVESLPTVVATDGITLAIANMIVCRDQDAYSIVGCKWSAISLQRCVWKQTVGGRHGEEGLISDASCSQPDKMMKA